MLYYFSNAPLGLCDQTFVRGPEVLEFEDDFLEGRFHLCIRFQVGFAIAVGIIPWLKTIDSGRRTMVNRPWSTVWNALHAMAGVGSVSRGIYPARGWYPHFCPAPTWNVRAIVTKSARSGLLI